MDFVTHAATGALVGRALAAPGDDAPAAWRWATLGAAVALLPDADHVLELASAEAYLTCHRVQSHNVPVALLAVALAAAWPRAPWAGWTGARAAAVVGASLASHFALDVLTPFGTALLWPFTDARYALDGLPIVAPWMTALTVVLALWARRGAPAAARLRGRLALLVLAAWLAVPFTVARHTERVAAERGRVLLAQPRWTWPLDGTAWVEVAGAAGPGVDGPVGERVVRVDVDALGRTTVREDLPRARDAAGAPASLPPDGAPPATAPYLARFRVPVALVEPGPAGPVVRWEDAQYRVLDPNRPPLLVHVRRAPGSGAPAVEVEQRARGAQLALWAAVLAAALLAGRRAPTPPSPVPLDAAAPAG